MRKHYVICIIIIVFIFGLNIITTKYTNKALASLKDNMYSLKEELKNNNNNSNNNNINNNNEDNNNDNEKYEIKFKEISDYWDKIYNNLAYFLEHDELEKVKTELVSLEANINNNRIDEAEVDLNRGIFIVEHILQKNSLQLKNVF